MVNRDPAPPPLSAFPGVGASRSPSASTTGAFDAADRHGVQRPDATGVDGPRSVLRHQHRSPPRQHHVRRDQLVRRERRGLRRDGVRPDRRARRAADAGDRDALYLAILTDTGSFHYRNITARTFEICRAAASRPASIRRAWRARSTTATRSAQLKLIGAVLSAHASSKPSGRLAVDLRGRRAWPRAAGGTYDDTEGLINMPLTVKEIQAVAFFKETDAGRLARQPAIEGRRGRQRHREGSSAAAATRTPPAARVDGTVRGAKPARSRTAPGDRALAAGNAADSQTS